ncbi:hypothetical protein [Acidisoma silvae]|uniref:Uncharacterized protein n=1 Tax=Acidisoma silvae TaxID=2802396 RepID=A0A963YU33_9PROT|nr:hypothetical protein [Acidisoma silvae]MCB8877071.1 hypothetical protein [Acidisoma silvae]
MSAPANGNYIGSYLQAENTNTHIAWVDEVWLTREILSTAVLNADSSFEITPFNSIGDCVDHQDKIFDTVIYHSHDAKFRDFDEVETLSDAYPGASIILVSDAPMLDSDVLGKSVKSGASTYFLSRVTSLSSFVKILEHERARRRRGDA